MLDLLPLFLEHHTKFEEYHRILSLGDDFDVEQKFPELRDHLFVAELKPGDTLFIPSLWLHDVLNHSPSFGVNRWYTRPEQSDVHLCEYLKEFGPLSIGGALTPIEVKQAAQLSRSSDPPRHRRDYPKPKQEL